LVAWTALEFLGAPLEAIGKESAHEDEEIRACPHPAILAASLSAQEPIEAFAAARITVGCQASPLLHCPANFVTRRQMAVFFAKALGLSWPG
jgi:hypothetical protein